MSGRLGSVPTSAEVTVRYLLMIYGDEAGYEAATEEQLVTDGPFAETKEQLGGYFIVDVEDLDTAIALAAELPGAQTGAIEVRPLIGM